MTRTLLVMAALLVSSPAWADANLVEEKQCFQCHTHRKDWIGPSFHSIRMHWQGRGDTEKRLVAVITQGTKDGKPHWGKVKMPREAERPMVSDAEAQKIVGWIMNQ